MASFAILAQLLWLPEAAGGNSPAYLSEYLFSVVLLLVSERFPFVTYADATTRRAELPTSPATLVLVFLFAPGWWLPAAVAIVVLLAQASRVHRLSRTVLANAIVAGLSIVPALAVSQQFITGYFTGTHIYLGAALGAAAAMTSRALLSIAVSKLAGIGLAQQLPRPATLFSYGPLMLANGTFGAWMWHLNPYACVGFAIPTVAVVIVWRQAMRANLETQVAMELLRRNQKEHGADIESAAVAALQATVNTVGARDQAATLVLFSEFGARYHHLTEGTFRSTTSNGSSLGETWLERALALPMGVHPRHSGGTTRLLLRWDAPGDTVVVLRVPVPYTDLPDLQRCLEIADVIYAGTAMQFQEARTEGDPAAMGQLRDACNRLVTLVGSSPANPPTASVLTQLESVRGLVAAMLGRGTPGPDPSSLIDQARPERPSFISSTGAL